MEIDHAFAVILAGGKGERFWPLSTSRRPKQFLSLVGGETLLSQAVDRISPLIPAERVLVITNADLVEAAREAAPAVPPENIIGEPVGRDTAAAVALGAAIAGRRDAAAVTAVLTADHVIGDLQVFAGTLRDAVELASREGLLVTIGIEPRSASTGYGYIRAGKPRPAGSGGTEFFEVREFVEKPDQATARSYLEDGGYYWNSGMFVWSVAAIEEEFHEHRPQLQEALAKLRTCADSHRFQATMENVYRGLDKISIDYAVMEKARRVVMARGTFDWDDVGSWPSLADHFPRDSRGNTVVGDVEILEGSDNVVVSRDRLTALVGVSDMVVVQAGKVTLVCRRDRAQEVKQLVARLREQGGRGEVL